MFTQNEASLSGTSQLHYVVLHSTVTIVYCSVKEDDPES